MTKYVRKICGNMCLCIGTNSRLLNWSSVHSVPFNYCHGGILSYLFSECSYTPRHILQQNTKQTGGHHLVNFRWLFSKFEREKWELHHILTIKQILYIKVSDDHLHNQAQKIFLSTIWGLIRKYEWRCKTSWLCHRFCNFHGICWYCIL